MAKLTLFENIGTILSLSGVRKKNGRKIQESDLTPIRDAVILAEKGVIRWVGPRKSLPPEFRKVKTRVDLEKASVLPGFVECHTHSVFAGSRAHEFELRNQGMSYQQIAAQGGGILNTMTKTRKATLQELKLSTQRKVDAFVRQGVTCLEMKSGYALDLKNELKSLELMQSLKSARIVPTYLGAHAIPPEFSSAKEYLDFIVKKVLPQVKKRKLSRRVDIFVEKNFFEKAEAKNFLSEVKAMGFDVLIHADQLSLSGGADLAVEFQALSADHLIQVTDLEIKKLAASIVTCVLLPAADLYLKCAYPPARKLIEAGARVALATDFNPGSSPTQNLNLVGLLARLEMKMSLPEVIAAYTFNAACALGLQDEIGSLEVGKSADFISIRGDWQELFYSVGESSVDKTYLSGQPIDL